MEVRLAGETDVAGFRTESHILLAHQVPPDEVHWSAGAPSSDVPFVAPPPASASRPRSVARAAASIVPASFLRLCESVVLHRDPERLALLYRLLWRLVHEPGLRNDPTDADMMRAQHMAHAVRRDIHKMKSYLRFVPLEASAVGLPAKAAWYEPSHHIVETVAPWFAKRQGDQPWVIFTPECSARWDGDSLMLGPGIPRDGMPPADSDAQRWRTCFDQVFQRAARMQPQAQAA